MSKVVAVSERLGGSARGPGYRILQYVNACSTVVTYLDVAETESWLGKVICKGTRAEPSRSCNGGNLAREIYRGRSA